MAVSEMIDLWDRLRPIFAGQDGGQPEIVVVNLSSDAMRRVIVYLLENASQLNTGFSDLYERDIHPGSVSFAIDKAIEGKLIGVLSMSLMIDGYHLPHMGFYIQDRDFITMAYEMSSSWTPIALIALFEFFRFIKTVDEEVLIALNPYQFSKRARTVFELTLRDYLSEKEDVRS